MRRSSDTMSGMTSRHPSIRSEATSAEHGVTTLELFFDLVFVFALTQISALMAHDPTWHGVVRGLLLTGLMWWSWIGFAWVSNLVRADRGTVRTVLLAAMAAMFVISMAIPEAFDDLPGGWSGPVVVALGYFAFRTLHLVLFWVIADGDPVLRRTLLRFAPSMLGGTAILLVASQFHGTTQTLLWALALAVDYGGTYLVDARGWRLRSVAHFAERHGLIVIVALGESIVAIGAGATDLPISGPIVLASVLGLAVSAALWWIYFDHTAAYGEHALAAEPEETRPRLARDAYTFLHFPVMAGVVLLALGLKKVLEYVGDEGHHELSDPLKTVALCALFGGVALYLLGEVGFRWRTTHRLATSRLVAAGVAVAAVPLIRDVPALAQLAVLTVLLVALVVFESVRYAGEREAVQHRMAPQAES